MTALEPYTIYVDDSGSDDRPTTQLIVAALCIARVGAWRRFEKEWRAAERKYGFKHFHMTEFAACTHEHWCRECQSGKRTEEQHPWREWSSTKRTHVLRELSRIVADNTEYGTGLALPKHGIQEHVINSPEPIHESMGAEEFTFAIQVCSQEFAKWELDNRKKVPRVNFVFDNTENERLRYELAANFIADIRPRFAIGRNLPEEDGDELVGMAFQSRKAVPQLLAADMLAWTTAKVRAHLTGIARELHSDAKIPARVFLSSGKLLIGEVKETDLKRWVEKEKRSYAASRQS